MTKKNFTPLTRQIISTEQENQIFLSILQLFEKQVQKNPNHIAIHFDDQSITYQELNQKANELACYLIQLGLQSNNLVPICLHRNIHMIVGILAILKTGNAYVPIDPNYPSLRIKQILQDTNARFVLADKNFTSLYQKVFPLTRMVSLDTSEENLNSIESNNPTFLLSPNDLAYVIYTSGSTGMPKGVMITHSNLLNYLNWASRYYKISSSSILDFSSSLGFDFSVTTTLLPLINGAKIIICGDNVKTDPNDYLDYLRRHKVTLVKWTPSYFKTLLFFEQQITKLNSLKWIVLGGESVSKKEIAAWLTLKPHHQFVNEYGPTEATVGTVAYTITADNIDGHQNTIPIGGAIDNTQLFILSSHKKQPQSHILGELYIGGDSIAKGYLNQSELTKEKFIPNPFSNDPNDRLYKTGDLVRTSSDGNLEFMGRIDNQIKIRGFRVEIEEIEFYLNQYPNILQAVVVVDKKPDSHNQIIGMIVCQKDKQISPNCLRDYLQGILPHYMIPSAFVTMDELPLTSHGKVDRKALTISAETSLLKAKAFVTSQNTLQKTLVELWSQILQLPEEQISIYDNFFEIGGDSLKIFQLLNQINKTLAANYSVRLLLDQPSIAEFSEHIQSLDFEKTRKNTTLPAIKKRTPESMIRLSLAQEKLWLLAQLGIETPAYHIPLLLHFKGKLDIECLIKALQALQKRHEILRTIFKNESGFVHQHVLAHPQVVLNRSYINLGNDLEQAIQQAVEMPFDFSQPLFRVNLFEVNAQEHYLLICMHHMITDGWSNNQLREELVTLYEAYQQKRIQSLKTPALQFGDFAVWEHQQIHQGILDRHLDYWKKQLANLPTLNLPLDFPRPQIETYKGNHLYFDISRNIYNQLLKLSQQTQVSIFVTLLSIFNILLAKYSGQRDISVGIPVANRQWKETETLLGCFVNTLVIRSDLTENPTFLELLKRNQQTTFEAYSHQIVPFDQVVQAIQPKRDQSKNPLFQVMFELEPLEQTEFHLTDLDIVEESVNKKSAVFDLTLDFKITASGLKGEVEYNTDLFKCETIQRFIVHFNQLLNQVLTNPNQTITQLSLLTDHEKQLLLHDWNQTQVTYNISNLLHQLFEKQAKKTPNSIALVFEDRKLTYAKLNEKSNQFARYLQQLGVKPKEFVALYVERSVEMMIALLGILKAGASYIPMDCHFPADRIKHILEETQPVVLITQNKFESLFHKYQQPSILIEQVVSTIQNYAVDNLNITIDPNDAAYVIYTSSSTGKAKGVVISHRSISQRLTNLVDIYGISPRDNYAQYASISFDASLEELFLALIRGGQLVIAPPKTEFDVQALGKFIDQHKITVINFTPTLLDSFLKLYQQHDISISETLRCVISGGEILHKSTTALFFQLFANCNLFNTYGPTEATVDTTYFKCFLSTLDTYSHIPIGKPLANTTVYVLDRDNNLVPIGVPGELHVGGVGLAKGYLNRDKLNQRRFIFNPFSKNQDRLYKTGDLVRWLPDGNLEYLGRMDKQVKIRGFRIELEEVENTLLQHPKIDSCAVIKCQDKENNDYLAAYIVLKSEIACNCTSDSCLDGFSIRHYLVQKLPKYMIPLSYAFLEKLPLTTSGKIDKRSLPEPSRTIFNSNHDHVALETPTEKKLAQIWETLLHIKKIGKYDDFFELGGYSILATQMLAKIKKTFHVDIAMCQFFQIPTIAELALKIDAN